MKQSTIILTPQELGLKWRNIARLANGLALVFAASDNYSPYDRVERANIVINKEGFDWTDTSRGLFYDINTGKEGTWVRPGPDRSGLWMAAATEHIRNLNDDPPPQYIDGWIKKQLPKGYLWYQDDTERMGVHTDGMNTISHKRVRRYIQGFSEPFVKPTQSVEKILPKEVLTRLRKLKRVV